MPKMKNDSDTVAEGLAALIAIAAIALFLLLLGLVAKSCSEYEMCVKTCGKASQSEIAKCIKEACD